MSVILRGLLILILTFVACFYFVHQRLTGKPCSVRCQNYLCFMAVVFPVIESSINSFVFPINIIETSTFVFLLCNLEIFHVQWKRFRFFVWIFVGIVVSALLSTYVVNSFLSVYDKVLGIIIFFIVLKALKWDNLDFVAKVIKILTAWVLFFVGMQIIIGPQFSLLYSVKLLENRISSLFPDPQIAACAMSILAVWFWNGYLQFHKKKNLVLFFLLAIAVTLTGSRAASVGLIVAVPIALIFAKVRTSTTVTVLLIAGALIVCFPLWSKLNVFERLSTLGQAAQGRQDLYWLAAIDIFKDNWLTGIGPGNFTDYIKAHNIQLIHFHGGDEIYASQPESGYLMWLDEYGLLSFLWLLPICYLFARPGKGVANVSLIFPWLFAFVSLYNLSSVMLVFILWFFTALIYASGSERLSLSSHKI